MTTDARIPVCRHAGVVQLWSRRDACGGDGLPNHERAWRRLELAASGRPGEPGTP